MRECPEKWKVGEIYVKWATSAWGIYFVLLTVLIGLPATAVA